MSEPYLDQIILKRILHYNPDSGVFTWLRRADVPETWNSRYAGKIAGYNWKHPKRDTVYRLIRIFDWPFLAHRVAYLYMTGNWPEHQVDHRDLDGMNNKWSNLRPATNAQNNANTRRPRTNTSGFKGVNHCSKTGRYRATIRVDGRQKWLGYFDTPEEAHAAYCEAAAMRSGEFARTS